MRLSDAIARINLALDNVNARKWDAAGKTVTSVLNAQVRSIVREMTIRDQGYSNARFILLKTAARTVALDVFSYRIPSWVSRIVCIRQYLGAGSGRGQELHPTTRYRRGGWRYTGVNEITLDGFSAAIDLEFEVAKLPALLTKGTLPAQSGTNLLKLDADNSTDALNFPHETEVDAYAGALFEITGPFGAGTRIGQVLRCVSSTNDPTGRVLTMEENWASPPVLNDTYEMRAELPEEHCDLLVLLAVRRLLAQEGNVKGLAAYAPELNVQWDAFKRHVSQRDVQEPYFIGNGPFDFVPAIGQEMT